MRSFGSGRPAAFHTLSSALPHTGAALVAEDDDISQRVAVGMLESLGYTVRLARNGEEAVALADQHRFHVILMDCRMPVMDGYAATRHIRAGEAGRRTPIVALTASAMAEDRQRCLDAGMDEHLAKPLRRKHLADVLEHFVSHAHERLRAGRTAQTATAAGDVIRARLDELFDGLSGDIATESAELLDSFLRRATDQLRQLNGAATIGDAPSLRAVAHSMKGMAANVGAVAVAAIAASIEDMARDGHLDEVERTVLELGESLVEIETVIRR